MSTFLFQTGLQTAVIALIWFYVSRDATRLRERHGTTPSGISPFAWGALCGLTWVALIPYLSRRRNLTDGAPHGREKNLLPWWLGLAALAIVWSAVNGAHGDANNAAQHGLLAAALVVCACIAWSRDRAPDDEPPLSGDVPVTASDQPR